MVKSRMENRVDNVEREVTVVQRDISRLTDNVASMREMLVEMRNWMRQREMLVEMRNWMRQRDEEAEAHSRNREAREESSRASTEQPRNGETHTKNEWNGDGGNHRGERGNRRDWGGRKLELSLFTGEDPYGWIFKVERYFAINQISNEHRVQSTAPCMEGEALHWYQWAEATTQTASDK